MSTTVGFVLGFCVALYLLVFLKQKKEKNKSDNAFRGISVFINFLIISKDEAIKQGVEGKCHLYCLMRACLYYAFLFG